MTRAELRFQNVTFGYEPDRPVLREVTLGIEPGETVALMGSTGAGKSTLAALALRFLDPWSGQVQVAGKDARAWTLASLRAHLAYLPQEPHFLPRSVADNIALSRPQASREEIVEAAQRAQAHEFIERLPQGYDTLLGERASTLSLGERQRLALARTFLRTAPLIILDEPASALDAGTERLILEALRRFLAERSCATLLITHRPSTLRLADRLVILEAGRVVRQGSWAELKDVVGSHLDPDPAASGTPSDPTREGHS